MPFPDWLDQDLRALAAGAAGDVAASMVLGEAVAPLASALGSATAETFFGLATLGYVDLTTARVLEPHVDALAILAQAGLRAGSRCSA